MQGILTESRAKPREKLEWKLSFEGTQDYHFKRIKTKFNLMYFFYLNLKQTKYFSRL